MFIAFSSFFGSKFQTLLPSPTPISKAPKPHGQVFHSKDYTLSVDFCLSFSSDAVIKYSDRED